MISETEGSRCLPGRGYLRLSLLLLLVLLHAGTARSQIAQNTVESYLLKNRSAGNTPNRLIDQNSPYLLQHAYNPVQWYPWGAEAIEEARRQNKPIFLSIGYSTCYWCHVMAHESFENEKIAAILNKHFISIKIDREERPDIDRVYMAATELINGYGGWPMTVFLNHRLQPFHAGVYYPPVSTGNSTGLVELLTRINGLWHQDRERIDTIAAQISTTIKSDASESMSGVDISDDVTRLGMKQISDDYDNEYAGFGAAPKFPRPGIFTFLLNLAASNNEYSKPALHMVRDTLVAMSQGGIHDHVGGGFHRYSVDEQWRVPHFEKMLYTQALMSLAYTRLYEIEPDTRYRDVVSGILDFVLREMLDSQGAFYSALDAGSERPDQPGVQAEGAYYLWTASELESLLKKDEWRLVKALFDIRENGNIESDPRNEFAGLNIFYTSDEFSNKTLTDKESTTLNSAMCRLLQARLQRPRPHLDDKIITAWNGIMIKALVEAARVFDNRRYLDAAVAAADFIQHNLVDRETRSLYRRVRAGNAGMNATLDDYAWYINALLALHAATNDRHWLDMAQQLTATQEQLFYDADIGGFYESGVDDYVLFRSKSAYDGALPAANAIAVENLILLADFTGNRKWRQMADETLVSFAATLNNDPASAAWMSSVVSSGVNRQ